MAGVYAHGARVDVHGYHCYNTSVTEELPNVWTVHPPGDGRAVDAVNLGAFKSAAEIEAYLLDLAERRERRGE